MKIVSTEIFVLADPPPGPDEAAYQLPSPGAWPPRIRELACLRIHTDEGLTGLSEIFSVPGGVAKAVLDGPEFVSGTASGGRGSNPAGAPLEAPL